MGGTGAQPWGDGTRLTRPCGMAAGWGGCLADRERGGKASCILLACSRDLSAGCFAAAPKQAWLTCRLELGPGFYRDAQGQVLQPLFCRMRREREL